MPRLALLGATALLCSLSVAAFADGGSCFDRLALSRNGHNGVPHDIAPTPDGRSILFLRSGPRDTHQQLYRYDVASRQATLLAGAPGGAEHLSVEEKARRERERLVASGITAFEIARDGRSVLASEGGNLLHIALDGGKTTTLPGSGWIGPHLSPDGRFVAAVKNDDVQVIDLSNGQAKAVTQGGTDTVTHGLSEFAAAEELERQDGFWWSPDSTQLLFEEADNSGVETHYITDPEHPQAQPVSFRYPRAGTPNARVRLGLVSRDGGAVRWLDWDGTEFPYLVHVAWPDGKGPLTLVVQNRAQTEERLLAVDPATGKTRTLLTETDPAWINIDASFGWKPSKLPRWLPDGSGFLWAAERNDHWQLELHHADGSLARVLTPATLSFVSLEDLDAERHSIVVRANPDRIDSALYRIDLQTGATTPLANQPGMHSAQFSHGGHDIFVDTDLGADGSDAAIVRDRGGREIGRLPDDVLPLDLALHMEFTQAGPRDLDAVVIRPDGFDPHRHYPVLLSVYAGPGVKTVMRAPHTMLGDQCLADQGFIVVAADGRGTPGRGHDWERATKNDLIDLPLQDQVDGLQALGKRYHQMDMHRAGVFGWSFGGYFTAMATIRRPDVFAAGVAGAPPVEFSDYDTAYTERYLGTPQADPKGYQVSDVLTYAPQLSRPLLIMHGITDDNVYFENTMKLTQALLRAGKPYDLLLLPGTHMIADPALAARVDEARTAFFKAKLGNPS